MDLVIRHVQPQDRDAVNAVAGAAFAQYQHAYQDWPTLDPIHGVPYARYVLPAEDLQAALGKLAAEAQG